MIKTNADIMNYKIKIRYLCFYYYTVCIFTVISDVDRLYACRFHPRTDQSVPYTPVNYVFKTFSQTLRLIAHQNENYTTGWIEF